jgi:hypothetical protein
MLLHIGYIVNKLYHYGRSFKRTKSAPPYCFEVMRVRESGMLQTLGLDLRIYSHID